MADRGPPRNPDEDLAYGNYHEGSGGTDRGIIGDAFRRFRHHGESAQSGTNVTQQYQPQLYNNNPPGPVPVAAPGSGVTPASGVPIAGVATPGSRFDALFNKGHDLAQKLGREAAQKWKSFETHSHTHVGEACTHGIHDHSQNRYRSFAPERDGNDVKWFVDGCGYMYAVSKALEAATHSIWILDWWLSPELYLRRPPAKNEQYRIDRMLLAAAQRGVKVNIIVYKEVTQALTRKYLSPTVPDYLHSLLPHNTNPIVSAMSRFGLAATFASLEDVETQTPLMDPPLTVSSSHTKHALEALHPNIGVFRHPDHLPDAQTLQSSFLSSLKNMSLTAATASKLPGDALKAIYGVNNDVVLYWAHHEKLCLIDGSIAFMGGLDLCYGRWDTNQHAISDAHPEDLKNIVFPGQDYNNARVMDFSDVVHWEDNKLDRTKSSRMGWSDISLCLKGPAVEDLRMHFVHRWNFIYNEKYDVRKDTRYSRLTVGESRTGIVPNQAGSVLPPEKVFAQSPPPPGQGTTIGTEYSYPSSPAPAQGTTPGSQYSYPPPPPGPPSQYQQEGQSTYFPPPPSSGSRGVEPEEEHSESRGLRPERFRGRLSEKVRDEVHRVRSDFDERRGQAAPMHGAIAGSVPCQIVRSCTKWSNGTPTEHSIANAYIDVIAKSQHFVYIENQFFITATSDLQMPIRNKIGAAIVDRILRAAKAGQKYQMIVVMPSVPAFAGDLKDEGSLGTRAIMEFQYDSINRGGHSIYESIAKEGFNPLDYIRFYNLRNYDRINASGAMKKAEQQSGVPYEDARKQYDDMVGAGFGGQGEGTGVNPGSQGQSYQAYQAAAQKIPSELGTPGRWDSVSECYMLGGTDIRNVPWEQGNIPEIDAFVSEELYVHSKILIADDSVVICGSANLNDRSQLGDHDSEIAVIIHDPTPVQSAMNGQPWQASKFATTLRRQIFRKHLGLIHAQDPQRPDANFEPIGVPNKYDFGSPEDQLVTDPLSANFLNFWNARAKQNTDAFGKIFHPVPHDSVRNWKEYDNYFSKYFHGEGSESDKKPPKYEWGHVVREEFSPGDQGLREVKELLSTVKGTLVEMPLLFLIEEDIAKEGVSLNAFTEDIYT